jgi:2-amino-4-hydroxy-6-hydroxymethyldihydropteridine diphosphokinase
MATCLLGLGSNLGDSEATLRAAVADIAALPDVQVLRQSAWVRTRPVGGPTDQADYVNGAVVIESTIAPLRLLAELQQIEARHGRVRGERWSPRPLDIDILLYANEVSETAMLLLPHPRMTFRRFVLEPAAEIAPKMLHPVIGWPIEQLLLHLEWASDLLALVSPSDVIRERIATILVERRGARFVTRSKFTTADHHWPRLWSTWLKLPTKTPTDVAVGRQQSELPYAAAAFPKLSVLLDADIAYHRGADKLQWSTLVRQPGRGPTLRLQTSDWSEIESEAIAAVDAVWPDLGPSGADRLKST